VVGRNTCPTLACRGAAGIGDHKQDVLDLFIF
jgi:hypothetical protein